jgi:hypothetical protein
MGQVTAGKLRPNPDVVHRRLEDEIVLVHLETNRIFALNSTGARLWQLIEEGHDEAEIRARLLQEFDVTPSRLNREVDSVLAELAAEGLVMRTGGDAK